MIVTAHMRQLVQACFPETQAEAIELWHNISPVRFGDRHQWDAAGGFNIILAQYQIPEDAAYLAILKTECFVYPNTSTTPGFRNFSPPPTGGGAQWFTGQGTGAGLIPLGGQAAIHVVTNSSEFLIAKGGNLVTLQATLDSAPTADVWFICTTVYAYHISAIIADRIGGGEAFVAGGNT